MRRTAFLILSAYLAFTPWRAMGGDYVLDLRSDIGTKLSNLPENSWVKLNRNTFEEVWTPYDQRPKPADAPSVGSPHSIIAAWSSMAWDSNRGDLIFFGGGHANYPGNEVYRWRSATLQWERAALPSEVVSVIEGGALYEAVDGPFNAPIAAHTYDSSEFLPEVDRFITFGGAAFNTGRYFELADLTRTGPYLWDPGRANADAVSGTAGSQVNADLYPDVVGGEMWQNRHNLQPDFPGDPKPGSSGTFWINGTSAYATENGLDVLYLSANAELFKYTLYDLDTPGMDTYERLGKAGAVAPSGQGAGAYDPARNIFVRTSGSTFSYWSLEQAGPSNPSIVFTPTVQGGVFDFNRLLDYGLDYDPVRERFLLWNGESDIWQLLVPADLDSGTWILTPLAVIPGQVPDIAAGHTGILGKWKYVAALDAFLGAFDDYEGQIWAYKPTDWQPAPVERIPFIVSPAAGSAYQNSDDIQITVDSLDETVSSITVFADGIEIARGYSVPYQATWSAPDSGVHTLTAVAVGADGIARTAAAIELTVCGSGYCTEVSLQEGADGYAGTRDAYLSEHGAAFNYGEADKLFEVNAGSRLRSIIQFAIFESEGGPIPDDAVITSATLGLYKSSSYDYHYELRPILVPWLENEVTWLSSRTGVPWSDPGASAPGVDIAVAADAAAQTGWPPEWVNFDVTGALAEIAGGRPNHGWLLDPIAGNNNLKSYYSSEYTGDPTLRPRLLVQYNYPDPVTDTDGDGIGDPTDNCQLVPNADQRDTDGDGFGNLCDGDFNNDGITNAVDLGLFRQKFFTADPDGDFNGDGIVNALDLGIFKTLFFNPPGP